MKTLVPRLAVLGVCALLAISLAVAKGPPTQKDVDTLRNAYFEALDKYYAPYSEAKTDEERSKIKLDEKKDPAKVFAPKALDLARRAKGLKGVGIQSANLALMLSLNNLDQKGAKEMFGLLETKYFKDPNVGLSLHFYSQFASQFLKPKETEKWLSEKLNLYYKKGPNEDVRASALLLLSEYYAPAFGEAINNDKAIQMLNTLLTAFPKSRAAQRAEGAINRIKFLSVGKVAPDFEATDQDGKTFKLSEYRGQVIVLDFWGFW